MEMSPKEAIAEADWCLRDPGFNEASREKREAAAAVLARLGRDFPLDKVMETIEVVRDEIRHERALSNGDVVSERTFDHMTFVWENCLSTLLERYRALLGAPVPTEGK